MKIPTPRKLQSGSWFIQLRIDGRSVPITQPTKEKCEAMAMWVVEMLKSSRSLLAAVRKRKSLLLLSSAVSLPESTLVRS